MTPRVRVAVTGACHGLPELYAALRRHAAIEDLGWWEDVQAATSLLDRSRPSVVLHATKGSGAPASEVAVLREHTLAPIVLLAPGQSPAGLEEVLGDVSDVLLLPQEPETVVYALRKACRRGRPAAPAEHGRRGRVITVFAPKGGVGKSVIATSLAVAITAAKRRRTLLVDLDLQFGDAAIMLGLDPEKTIYDLVTAAGDLDEEKLSGFVVRHESGLDVLAAPLRPEDAEPVTERAVTRLLGLATAWYDTIVVDTSPLLDDVVLGVLGATDELLLVCDLDAPTLKNARTALRTLELLAFPPDRIHIILNRPSPKPGLSPADADLALGAKPAFEIPYDPEVAAAVDRGNPEALRPGSEFRQAMVGVSDALLPGELETAPSARLGPARRAAGRGERTALAAGGLAAALIALGAWKLASGGGPGEAAPSPPAPDRPSTPGVPEPAPAAGEVLGVIASKPGPAAAGEVPGTAASKPRPAEAAARLVLRAARGPCWLEVHRGRRSGKLLFRGTLAEGRSVSFTGERLWLRLGWPSNLRATLNGKAVRLPTRTATVVATPKGLRTIKIAGARR